MGYYQVNRSYTLGSPHGGTFLSFAGVLSVLALAVLLAGSVVADPVHAFGTSGLNAQGSRPLSLTATAEVHPDAAECYRDLTGDADCDCRVTLGDIGTLAASWRQVASGIADGGVNVSHIVKAATQLGERCLPTAVATLNRSDTNLAAARVMGANYARIWVEWGRIEPVQGQRDWSSADNVIRAVADADLHPIVEAVRNIPPWARKPEYPWSDLECGLMADGQYVAGPSSGFWQFIHELVERYDGDGVDEMPGLSRPVRLWEAGNEPESSKHDPTLPDWAKHHGVCYGPIRDPNDRTNLDKADYLPARKYAELMRVFTDAIHTADPYGLSVFGGMMYWVNPNWGLDSHRWLDEVLKVSQPSDFDIMNIHAYIDLHCGETMGDVASQVRGEMAGYGISKPVMVTEAGRKSHWVDGNGNSILTCGAVNTEQLQAAYVPQLYTESMAADLFLTVWYTQKDYSSTERYGLLRSDYSEKPAYLAYQTWVNQMSGATFVRALTAADTGSTGVEGFEFRTRDGRLKWVLWTSGQGSNSTKRVAVPWRHVRVTGHLGRDRLSSSVGVGEQLDITDGSADDLGASGDGVVTLEVGSSPIYVGQE